MLNTIVSYALVVEATLILVLLSPPPFDFIGRRLAGRLTIDR
jgi:hypothetical protein